MPGQGLSDRNLEGSCSQRGLFLLEISIPWYSVAASLLGILVCASTRTLIYCLWVCLFIS